MPRLLKTHLTLSLVGMAALCGALSGCEKGRPKHTEAADFAEEGETNAPDIKVLTVFAATSLGDVMNDVIERYASNHQGLEVRLNCAASSTLAKQIEAGAGADVYVSANEQWMSFLAEQGLIERGSRRDIARNALVLIAPKGHAFSADIQPGFHIEEALDGKLAVADPDHVPAGIYAKEALNQLGWWEALEDRMIPAADVRAALRLVEMNEVAAGIVYRTDASASKNVEMIGAFPDHLHRPIVYSAGLVQGGSQEGRRFLETLKSEWGKEILLDKGFLMASAQ